MGHNEVNTTSTSDAGTSVTEIVNAEGVWEEFMGEDLAVMRVSPGSGPTASMKTIVKANVKIFVEGESTPVEVLTGASFKVGDGDAIPGLELPLRHSSVGEFLKAKCSWKFGFGPDGRPESANAGAIPAKANLHFEIEVVEHVEPLEGTAGISQEVALKKECGNRWFAYGDFMRAARSFSQGGKSAESILSNVDKIEDTPEGRETKRLFRLYIDCLNNLAACHLGNKDPFKAREACIKVIEMDRFNKKGLLRAGKASLQLHEYDESEMCFSQLHEQQQRELTALLHKRSALRGDKESPMEEATGAEESHSEVAGARGIESVDDDEKISLEEVEKQIAEMNANIETTNGWLKKVEKGKKAYKNREKVMAGKIAKGLFGGAKAGTKTSSPSEGSISNSTGREKGREAEGTDDDWVQVERSDQQAAQTAAKGQVEESDEVEEVYSKTVEEEEGESLPINKKKKISGEKTESKDKKPSAASFSMDTTTTPTPGKENTKDCKSREEVPEHENLYKMAIAGLIMALFVSGMVYALMITLPGPEDQ